jgi:hypothetical protein
MPDTAARLALYARRYEVARFSIAVEGIDLTGVPMSMQVRLQRGTPGAPLIQLDTVTTAAAAGLKLDSVTVTDGVPTSVITGRINKSTMDDPQKVPFTGEVGQDDVLAYAMQWTLGGDAQTRIEGDFIVRDSAYGSDSAPLNRPAGYGATSRMASAGGAATLSFGDQVIKVSIAGAELLAPIAGSVSASAATAQTAAQQAQASARATAFADTNPNLFTRAELAFTDLGRLVAGPGFSTEKVDGAPMGVIEVAAGGSVLPTWRFPRAVFGDAQTIAASLSAELLTGATTGGAASLQIRQRKADTTEIAGTRTTVAIAGIEAIAVAKTVGQGRIALHADCAFVDYTLALSGNVARTFKFRAMLLAGGAEFGFRLPPIKPATSSETSAGTDSANYVTPAALAASAPALVGQQLIASGLSPDIVDFIVRQSAIELPAGLNWPSRWPDTVVGPLTEGKFDFYKARALARTLVPAEVWSVPPIYVDFMSGNNANNGSSMSQAFRYASTAVAAGAATGKPVHLIFKQAQVLPRVASFASADLSALTMPLACTVEGGGSAVSSNHDVLTWAIDGTYGNCWSAARSGAARASDPSNRDADGLYARYEQYASPAALNAAGAVDGWATDGTKVYARRADSGAVSDANCRVYLAVRNFEMTNAKASVYLEGLKFEGGSTGAVHFESTADVNFAAVDCFFGYTTRLGGSERDAFRMRNFGGLLMLVNGFAAEAHKDAINQHVDIGTSLMPGIYVNPKTRRVGTAEGNSKNAFTLHETARGIVINPDFPPTINGSTIANVGDSKCIVFGGSARANAGSGAGNGAVELTDNAEAWFIGTEIIGDIVVSGNTKVYLRNVKHTGNVVATGSGQVVMF